MPRSSTSQYAILGLLAQGARSGYDVRQMCETALVHFWSESYGQIYPTLRRLEERGWVEREAAEGEGRTRYLHRLTDQGRDALEEWIGATPQPMRVRNELLLKVFLGRQGDPDDLERLIEDFRRRIDEKRATLTALRRRIEAEEPASPDAPYWLLTLEYGLHSLDARAAWADGALERLRELRDETGGGA